MDIVSILSLGTVGLGFLLAFLAFRLLSTGKSNERPIYIFMVFCLALVAVGAALQFYGSRDTSSAAQKDREIADLQERLAAAKTDAISQRSAVSDSMKNLIDALDRTSRPIAEVNNRVTSPTICPGDNNGVALPNANLDSANLNTIVAEISTAKQTARQYVQP